MRRLLTVSLTVIGPTEPAAATPTTGTLVFRRHLRPALAHPQTAQTSDVRRGVSPCLADRVRHLGAARAHRGARSAGAVFRGLVLDLGIQFGSEENDNR
jgi:hypothetical protein